MSATSICKDEEEVQGMVVFFALTTIICVFIIIVLILGIKVLGEWIKTTHTPPTREELEGAKKRVLSRLLKKLK